MTKFSASERMNPGEKTIFLLGNGPSLRTVDLKALTPFAAIGMNAAYRYWRKIDWRPAYYACLDLTTGLSHRDEIFGLIEEGRIQKFLLRENLIAELAGKVAGNSQILNFDALRFHAPVLRVPGVTTGSHAALWAAWLGYREIVLLGVDAHYTEVVPGARRRKDATFEIVEDADNPNYFFQGYQQPGDRYNTPNPKPGLHVDAWKKVAIELKRDGVAVYNGNPASAVRVFPYIDVDDFLSGGAVPTAATQSIPDIPLTQMPLSRSRRIWRFLKSHAAVLGAALTAVAAMGFAFVSIGAAPGPVIFSAALFLGLFLFALYVRAATIDHLRALDARTERLETASKDFMRTQSCPEGKRDHHQRKA